MWWGTEPDPGGSQASGSSTTNEQQELNELKDQSEQQQKLIAQLKEMLRKTDQMTTSASLEKAEKLTSTLSKMQSRAKKNKQKKLLLEDKSQETQEGKIQSQIDTPGKEKVNLLRKQLEENRVKLAERGKHQKGIEDKVTQLKAQLDDSQALVNQSLSNISITKEPKLTPSKITVYSIDSSNEELFALITEKDQHINELNSRIEQLEANVLDLQENLKEKDSVIEARTKAITLMSEDLSRRGKSTLDMLDETKEQMRLMQNNFIKLEDEMKIEKQRLIEELEVKNKHSLELEETNHSLNNRIHEIEEQLKSLKDVNDQLTNDNRLYSEQLAEKDKIIQELQEKVKSNENEPTKNKKMLKKELEVLRNENVQLKEQIFNLEKQSSETTGNTEDVEKLKKQLDEMNKSMIKLKAQNKSKIKELQKQIDLFKKTDDIHAEFLKINAENNKLKQTIAELEEEKGNLQLNLVDFDTKSVDTNMQGIVTELKHKLEQLQFELEEKEKATITIQKEKDELNTEMENRQIEFNSIQKRITELSQMEAEHVKTQMTSAHLEEQLDELKLKNDDLTQQVSVISKENIALHERIETIITEKQELNTKLENLIHENIDLVDRLEKLSAEKVSSAESIEIVESLTQQEKLEIEEFHQKYNEPDTEEGIHELEQNPELNDSVTKLTEESVELIEKIELFTIERKEVMEKMEHLTLENSQLNEKLKTLEQEKLQLEETYETLFDSKVKIEQEFEQLKQSGGKSTIDNVDTEQIEYYKNLVTDQEMEVTNLREELSKSQKLLEDLGVEKATIESTLQEIIKEKDEITESLTESINKIKYYDEKITENDSLINSLNNDLNIYNNRIQQAEKLLEEKDVYIAEIEQDKNNKEIENNKLKNEIQTVIQNFQSKYHELETKIDSPILKTEIENLQQQCITLDNTNKEQLQRMKKIAAHLKKKTTACEELEKEVDDQKQIIETLTAQIKEQSEQIDELLKSKQEVDGVLKSNQQTEKELLKLKDDLGIKEQQLQQNEMIIENIEQEKNHYFNKNSELSEQLSLLQNEKQNLEANLNNLNEQLQLKTVNFNELMQSYRQLDDEFTNNNVNIKQLQQKIEELTIENNELLEQNQINNNNIHTLQQQLNTMDEKYRTQYLEQIENYEDINSKLQSQVIHLENDLIKVNNDLKIEKEQFEKYEYESTIQYDEYNNERKKLIETNERLNNEFNAIQLRIQELENENKEQIKEIDNKNDIIENYQKEINDLQYMFSENEQKIEEKYKKIIFELEEKQKQSVDLSVAESQTESYVSSQDNQTIAEPEIKKAVHVGEQSVQSSQSIEHSLNEKIKTLQFMLHDSEKSKEDILEMCQELLNEIAWREYENNRGKSKVKVKSEVSQDVLTNIESEIIVGEEKPNESSVLQPISSQSNQNRDEEVITCKKAYKCYTPADEAIILDNEENLWGSDEAKLEDVHIQNTTVLESKIKILENERNQLLEELKQLQIRSNKMLKKLKEFKEKNDRLTNQLKQNCNTDDDLNKAIENELKSQITSLEKQLKEIKLEKEQESFERKSILQQIEQLKSENIRLKENYNVTLIDKNNLQLLNNQLNDKINELKWDSQSWDESTPKSVDQHDSLESNHKINDLQQEIVQLNQKINDLSIDNEEMQCLLEEQVELRKQLEKKLGSHKNTDSQQLWDDYNKLVKEKNDLILELTNLKGVSASDELRKDRDDLLEKYHQLLEEIKTMIPRTDFKNLQDEFNNLQLKYQSDLELITNEKLELTSQLKNIQIEYNNLIMNLDERIQLCNELTAWKNEAEVQANELKLQIEQGTETIKNYSEKLNIKEMEIEELTKQNENLKVDVLDSIKQELKIKDHEIEELKKHIESIKHELTIKENEIEVLKKQNENMKADVFDSNIKEDKIETLKHQLTIKENEIEVLKTQIENMKADVFDSNIKENEIETLKQQLNIKENEIEILKKENANIKADVFDTSIKENEIETLKQELMIKSNEIIELKKQSEILESIKQELNIKENEMIELKSQHILELDNLKSTLATAWVAEVDKRGTEVAESWKAHLDQREYEFSQLETSLRNEIQTLQDKYTTLLENKSETEIQQSETIHEERQKLTQTILQLETKINESENKFTELNEKNIYYKNEIDNFNSIIEVKDAQIQQLTHELQQIKEKLTIRLNEIEQLTDEKFKLTEHIENIERHLKENEIQIQNLNIAINMKNDDILKLKENETLIENEQILLLNNEINELKRLLAISDEKCSQLVSEKNNESQNYIEKLKLKDHELELKDVEIKAVKDELNNKIQEFVEIIKLKDQSLELKDIEMKTESNNKIQEYVELLKLKDTEINDIRTEIESKYSELKDVENKLELRENEIKNIQNELEMKDIEIKDIKNELNLKNQEYDNLHSQLDNNVPFNNEISKLNEIITSRENDLINLQTQLDIKTQQCMELENKIAELDYMINEDTKQMSDLKDIIESQVLKIEKLKSSSQENLQQSDEEKSLEKHVHFPESEQLVTQHYYERSADQLDSQELDSGSELVSKAELELALYMLHQRDVRCEELTVELMQLLEERDTLQLRLSNSIRMNEELRRKLSPRKLKDSNSSTSLDENLLPSDPNPSTPVRKSKSSDILIGATGAEIAKEATEEHEDTASHTKEMAYLENKLSELQSVDHRRDVRLKDEKEARHIQLSLLQQHRDLSMLPAEAAARLVDANYTLSRESESASTVLLNWLWGKSTPKVNHL